MSVDAVLFDLDGVLVDSAQNHWLSYNDALRPLGIEIELSYYYTVMGMRREDALRKIAAVFGLSFDIQSVALAKETSYLKRIAESPCPILPVIGLVHELARTTRLALVTGSYGRSLDTVLSAIGLGVAFDTVVSGRDVSHGKPAPDGYLLAALRLLVAPVGCVVVEDSPEGVASARAAGMRCVGILPPGIEPSALRSADLVVPDRSDASIDAIREYVASFTAGTIRATDRMRD